MLLLIFEKALSSDYSKSIRSKRRHSRKLAMDLEMKHDESFCNILLKYLGNLIEISPNIFKFVAVAGFIAVVSYMFYSIHEQRFKKLTLETKHNVIGMQDIKNYNRAFIRHRSIISHKEMLRNLEYAAEKCYDKFYALKCIDIIVYCPQLLNVQSPLNGVTPFHRICFHGGAHLVAFALAKGADPFITTITGENALCMAVYYFLNNPKEYDFSFLNTLKTSGCPFGLRNKWYNVLLKMAHHNNNIKLMQWLILHKNVSPHKISRCLSMPPILKNYKIYF
ncbi:uncharacterized protein LOC143188355 [Calliopsis andreniformis]|uniref:uncharacterized protein LOC143188355 n=1 Tax=Calliopsis andreniformis TaxID=337506 RepID=UPI003FCED9C1